MGHNGSQLEREKSIPISSKNSSVNTNCWHEEAAMGRGLVVICILQICVSAAVRAQQEAPVTDCDRYAASEFDSTQRGVPFEQIIPNIAVPACEDAVRTYPDSARLLYELGRAYLKKGDFEAALTQLRKAGGQGYAPALNEIGTMYSDGFGVPKDEGEAVKWYRNGAERGYVGGQLNLAFMYENGRGVPRDYKAAFQWYSKAAAQGSARAEDSLGYFYGQGIGVKRDDVQSVAWFRKAAEQGMAGAQYNLGTMYDGGFGVPEDRIQAIVWFRRAANQGNDVAKKKLAAMGVDDKTSVVTARGVSVVPGAIVCPDHATVSLMFDLYVAHWGDVQQDALTNGQSRLLRGPPAPEPDLKLYGCGLVPPGASMLLERGNIVPVVTAKLPDGRTIRGVTLAAMIGQ
jgi:TPR repeat protein